MKKTGLLIFALLVCLCAFPAHAESRVSVYNLGEDTLTVHETLYHSEEMALSFWYDAAYLTVEDGMSEGGNSLAVYPAAAGYDMPVFMEFILPAWDETGTLRFLTATPEAFGIQDAGEISLFLTETGLGGAWRMGTLGEIEYQFYVLWSNAGQIHVIFQRPTGAYDDTILRMETVLKTVEFL